MKTSSSRKYLPPPSQELLVAFWFLVAFLLLVAMPGFLVAMPGTSSSILVR